MRALRSPLEDRRRILAVLDQARVTDRATRDRDGLAERLRRHVQDNPDDADQRSVAEMLEDEGLGRAHAPLLLGAAGDVLTAYTGRCSVWPGWCAEESTVVLDDEDFAAGTAHRRWTAFAFASDEDLVVLVGVQAVADRAPSVVVALRDGTGRRIDEDDATVALTVMRAQVLVRGLQAAVETLARQSQPARTRAGQR